MTFASMDLFTHQRSSRCENVLPFVVRVAVTCSIHIFDNMNIVMEPKLTS